MSSPTREENQRKRTDPPASRTQQEDEDEDEDEDEPPREKKARTWEESFNALVAYKETHGDFNVPKNYQDYKGLARWRLEQKSRRFTKLTQEQRDRLDELGFDWETLQERQEREWDEKFERLKAYHNQHPDSFDPKQPLTKRFQQDPELMKWVAYQRSAHSQGRMRKDYQTKLEDIGFSWSETQRTRDMTKKDKNWFEQYEKLVDFSKANGHCMVPDSYKENKSLGKWVTSQRGLHSQMVLRQDRKELLDKVGFVWKIGRADAKQSLRQRKWDDMFAHLVEYKQINNHTNVPQNYKENELGDWVSHQRKQHRKGLLDPQRAQRLLEIGLTWGTDFDQRWNEKYEQLAAFHQKNGHCKVPTGENVLARWVQKQRLCQGTLPPERKAKLGSLGFDFQVTERKRKARKCKEVGVADMEPRNVERAGLNNDELN